MTSTGIGLVVYVVTSRVLAPDDFGVVAFGLSVVMLASCLVPLGFGAAVVQRDDLTESHLDSVFWLCAAVGMAVYVALILGAGTIARRTSTPGLEPVIAVLGTRIIWDSLATVQVALLYRTMNYRAFAVRTAYAHGVGGLICIALIWVGAGYWALVASQVIGSFITLVVVSVTCGWRPRWAFDVGSLRQLAPYALSSSGTRLIQEMRLDQILLGSIAGSSTLGLYFFGRKLWQLLLDFTVGVFSPVTSVLFASMQNEPDKARQAFLLASFAVTTAGLPLFAGMIAVADTAVPLIFGDHWVEAIYPLQALSVHGMVAVIGVVQATLITGHGYAGWWLRYQSMAQFGSVPIILLLFPHYGLNGVVTAMVLLTLLLWPLSVRKTLRVLGLPFRDYLASLAGPLLTTVGMVAAVELVPAAAPHLHGWARLGAEVGTGLLTYMLLAGLISMRRLGEIASLLQQRRRAAA